MSINTPGATSAPLCYSVPEAARMLGIGRSLFYELLMSGKVRSFCVGTRRLVPADTFLADIASLAEASGLKLQPLRPAEPDPGGLT